MAMTFEGLTDTDALIECDSWAGVRGLMRPLWPTEVVKREPMLFSADLAFARERGGPITRAWLDALGAVRWDAGLIIDTRVHILMPGFWPCIPGWHHDDVPREREDGQPDYFTPSYRTRHVTTIVGDTDGLAATEYALGDCPFPDVPLGEKYYKVWSPMVDEALANGWLEPMTPRYGDLVEFSDRTWHQGVRAEAFGWRWFARATYGSRRAVANEVRSQVQVYLTVPEEGW